MPASVEKTYSDALYSLIVEEHGEKSVMLGEVLGELEVIGNILTDVPELIKLFQTPTIPENDKKELIEKAFSGKISIITFNFLNVLISKGRMGVFNAIYREYRRTYNEAFGIVDITVTTTNPLDEVMRAKVQAKMVEYTGKKVNLIEKIDSKLIGGIIIDYGSTRLDGSVKTRFDALKKDISNIIA